LTSGALAKMEAPTAEPEVELALFEQDKENLRPKRTGRSARALQEVYCTDPKELADHRQEARQEFEARLEELSDDTELQHGAGNEKVVDLWLEYANWAAEMYPKTPSEERSVLERATNFLVEKPEFNSSPGHLKLWLRLAAMEREPQEIFYFLFSNNIGKAEPALYEEWAFVMERRKEYKRAYDLMLDGMFQCRNTPNAHDRLYNFQEALRRRMVDLDIWEEWSADPDMLSLRRPQRVSRPVLNPITSDEAKELNRPLESRPVESRRLSGGRRPAMMRVKGRPGFANVVCEDLDDDFPDFHEGRESLFSTSALVPRRAPEVESVRQKENKQTPEAAFAQPSARAKAGRRTKKPSSNAAGNRASDPSPALPVYVDDEFQGEVPKTCKEKPCLPPAASGEQKSKGGLKTPDCPSTTKASPGFARFTSLSPMKPSPTFASTPAAPQKESRRKRRAVREAAEETASSSLAASMSQLQIQEEPPAKRVCRKVEAATPHTPPRRKNNPAQSGQNGKSPQMERGWSPPRTSPRQGRRGSNTFSSGKSQKDSMSSKRSTKSDVDHEGLAGLEALQGMFGTRRGYGRSCSRLLVFED